MTIDLAPDPGAPWLNPVRFWPALDRATAGLEAPIGVVRRGAIAHDAHDLFRRARCVPIRVAGKSIRARGALDAVLALDGFSGVLADAPAEAVWLSETVDDNAYPTTDRSVLRTPASDDRARSRVTIMIDDPA